MIGDFKGGDETALAQALEAFDILANTTAEYHAKGSGGVPAAPGPPGSSAAPALQPPSSNPFQACRPQPLPHLPCLHGAAPKC
jgi:hypothetical protein